MSLHRPLRPFIVLLAVLAAVLAPTGSAVAAVAGQSFDGDITALITGYLNVGQTIEASANSYHPTRAMDDSTITLTIRRDSDGTVVATGTVGGLSAQPIYYAATSADVGSTLTVTAVMEKPGYDPISDTATTEGPIGAPIRSDREGYFTGSAAVGNTLTAVNRSSRTITTWATGATCMAVQRPASDSTPLGGTLEIGDDLAGRYIQGFMPAMFGSHYSPVGNCVGPVSPRPGPITGADVQMIGTPRIGNTLDLTKGSAVVPSSATLTASWYRCATATTATASCTPVTSTEDGHVNTADDVSSFIRAAWTLSAEDYTSQTGELTSAVITRGQIPSASLNVDSIDAVVGVPLHASISNAPNGTTATYGWYRGTDKVGSDAAYTPTVDDVGQPLAVSATMQAPEYQTTSIGPTVTSAVLPASILTISGTTRVGETLTAVTGSGALPADATNVHYYWTVGQVYDEEERSSVLLTPATKDQTANVALTFVAGGNYHEISRTSGVIGAGIITGTPTLTGSPVVGSTLAVVPGTITPAGTQFGVRWYLCPATITGDDLDGCTRLTDAPTLTAAMVGQQVKASWGMSSVSYTTRNGVLLSGLIQALPVVVPPAAPPAVLAPITVSDPTIVKGQTFTVTATGLRPGKRYRIWLAGHRAASGVVPADGTVVREVTFPASTTPGKRKVRVSVYRGQHRVQTRVVRVGYSRG